ncbi:sensor histidine kinase [Candidatus Nitrosotenuis cloacae]|uniref:sensor histidine kinase n=1 Tax=Candidatus Nitrosotenuis cloacae TaxID=1603555 RepID=UPI00227F090D|nr:ATP-binding protein [Candidatus Nitrosotenuis cloacae]
MAIFIDGHHVSESSLQRIRDSSKMLDETEVRIIDLLYNHKDQELYYILEASDEQAVRNHHKNIGMECNSIINVEKIHTKATANTERLAAIGELASRLAHDLRNPLSIIKNTVEIMESKPKISIENRIIYFNRLNRAIDRISHQIEDVLDFVRPVKFSFETQLINEIIVSAVEKIAKPDHIKINLPKNFVYLVCDFTKLEVVFTNLIINSIQAMNNSGQIDISLADGEEQVTIQITDTGCGITQDDMPKIFEPLFTTKQTGTGLGLASCKKIVEQHDGTIEASSAHGKTTFTITIPKRKVAGNQTIEIKNQ